ncbi:MULTISPECIES: DMT family transporter [unclassified Roseovarius]|uniref:DMT family transporter n=1 Tax=unclassified Roseovarius TaxID=2614913 RepID=UPI00273F6823|nr:MULTISPECIES: DMT family transporter [unclassified Roseovarius]
MKFLGSSAASLAGYAWMSLAVLIWASWLVLTSSGRTTTLSVMDLASFRAIVPTIVLAPLLWRNRQVVLRIGGMRCLLLSAYGAPFTLLVGYGLEFAPVAHAGALVPGLMPVFALAFACLIFGEEVGRKQAIAVVLILCGAATILMRGTEPLLAQDMWRGHLLFLAGAVCWACFTVTARRIEISAFLSTGIVGAMSTVVLVPIWVFFDFSRLSTAHGADIAFQVVFQGVIAGLVSMFAFGRALNLIGARASALSALTPGVAALLAVPILGQIPQVTDIVALCLVVTGLVAWNRSPSQAAQATVTKDDGG